ncbi:MAG: enolase C-terminal domain-like protein [Tepidisphaeraceae bacterium]
MSRVRPFVSVLCLLFASIAARAAVTIDDVRLIDYRVDRTKVFVTSKGQSDSCYGIFVLVSATDDAGRKFVGLGDALPRGLVTNETVPDAWAGAILMAAELKGKQFGGVDKAADVKTAEDWMAALDTIAAGQKLTTRSPPPADKQLRATLCGFDEAILDLMSQAHGVPLYELLGGAKRQTVTVSAMTYNADASAEELADKADDDGGDYGAMRLKVGLGDEEDVKKIGAVAAELVRHKQTTQIWVDVNQAWKSAEKSLEVLGKIRDALAASGFESTFICEQPTNEKDLPALAAVTAKVREWNKDAKFNIVIMADEAVWTLDDAKKMVELNAADALNIKIQKAGGLLASKRIADFLVSKSPETAIYVGGVVATDITSWANLQLCIALPRLDWATSCIPRRAYKVNVSAVPVTYKVGKTLAIPATPGLGTTLAMDKLKRYIRRDTANPATQPAN